MLRVAVVRDLGKHLVLYPVQDDVGANNQPGSRRRQIGFACARENANRCGAPGRCRGIEAADGGAFTQDHASTKEADASGDLRHDARCAISSLCPRRHHVRRRAEGNQRVGMQAGGVVAQLALKADERAQQQGQRKAADRLVKEDEVVHESNLSSFMLAGATGLR